MLVLSNSRLRLAEILDVFDVLRTSIKQPLQCFKECCFTISIIANNESQAILEFKFIIAYNSYGNYL